MPLTFPPLLRYIWTFVSNGTPFQYSCLANPIEGCSPWGRLGSDMTERLHFHFSLSCIGEGNGNPLQCSCLENPRDGGAWWAAVYGVAQSQTRLKWLSSLAWVSMNTKLWKYQIPMRYFVVWVLLCKYFFPRATHFLVPFRYFSH